MRHHPKAERVYQIIVEYIDRYGMSPTVREIQTAAEFPSTSMVNYHLKGLAREGRIIRHPWKARAIEIPGRSETNTARAGAMIAAKLIADAEPSRECIGDVVVSGVLMDQLKRWTERVGA